MGKSRGEGELGDDFSAFEHAAFQRDVDKGKAMVFPCLPQELSPGDTETLSQSLREYFKKSASEHGMEQLVRCELHISGRNVCVVQGQGMRSLHPKELSVIMNILQQFFS